MAKQDLTFKEGYDVLKKNAELLESQEEPDIDNLMKIQKPSKLEGFLYCIINFSMLQKFYPLF